MSYETDPAPWKMTPWRHDEDLPNARFDIEHGNDGEAVADCVYGKGNAYLVIAAPELLEALKRLVRNGQKQGWNDNYELDMHEAYSAIAKAEGKERS